MENKEEPQDDSVHNDANVVEPSFPEEPPAAFKDDDSVHPRVHETQTEDAPEQAMANEVPAPEESKAYTDEPADQHLQQHLEVHAMQADSDSKPTSAVVPNVVQPKSKLKEGKNCFSITFLVNSENKTRHSGQC